jgi:probable F420-dependent oxidoreductase
VSAEINKKIEATKTKMLTSLLCVEPKTARKPYSGAMNVDAPIALQRLDGTVGIWTTTHESLPPSRAHEVAIELEALGFAALWLPEAWGRESISNSTLMLQHTTTLVIATGIMNIYGRDAVSAANASRTLSAAFNERFVTGLGVSHQPLVERMRGHNYSSPIQAMREYLDAMDAAPMFANEGQQRYARVLAALGPKMLQLAAERTDGVHPYLVTPEHTALARASVGDKFIGVEQAVVIGGDREEFLRRAHAHLDIYTGLANYRNSWKRLGFDDTDFVRGGSDRLCDALVVHGDESAVVASIREHHAAGANHVCIQVLGADLNEVPFDEWRRLSEALK